MKKFAQEWLDTLVVAISVAMAFRAYFYEPFNIPTGSMQPTLWGYHVNETVQPSSWDEAPLSMLKWVFTGESYKEIKADRSGYVLTRDKSDGTSDLVISSSIPRLCLVKNPSEVGGAGIERLQSEYKALVGNLPRVGNVPNEVARNIFGKQVVNGQTIWKGTVTSGDYIFVNRWKWNFRKPRAGEVVIFETNGINGIAQGIHYIKRLKALPGETYTLEHPVEDWAHVQSPTPHYSENKASVTMGEDEYFACGDNFNNSLDSRYWGPVPGKNIVGTGSVVFWPFNKWRMIK